MQIVNNKQQEKGNKLFEPDTMEELLRGWLLHAHKSRTRHDYAARYYNKMRFYLGIPTTALSAIVGSSVFASLSMPLGSSASIVVGGMGIIATILSGLHTHLNYADLAEKHRSAATKYKSVVRQLEQSLAGPMTQAPSDEWINNLRSHLDGLEENVPVVAQGIYDKVDKLYTNPVLVGKALEQAPASPGSNN